MGCLKMTKRLLTTDEVTRGYQVLNRLYPHIPPLIIWRGWEYAAYRRFTLDEPVLDIGCGDGRFFRLVWPGIGDAVGLDINPGIVEVATNSTTYRDVYVAPAYDLPFESGSFASVFANCSLEHMDHLSDVFRHISRCLCPRGKFLFSVVTEKFLEWAMLPLLLQLVGAPDQAKFLQSSHSQYHHLVNAFSPEIWTAQLSEAHFEIEEYIPILPEITARVFLLLDHLWHVPFEHGEVGDMIPGIFARSPNFGPGLEAILQGLLLLERDWTSCAGAVFFARKIS
jgi:SAM-dependent methyltransferase